MLAGKGKVIELILENGYRHVRISCDAHLIPSPGQYLLAGVLSEPVPLPVSLFSTESTHKSFIACAPIPETWTPGAEIYLRGPLGRGFALPPSARKVALVAFDDHPARLSGLIQLALKQGAAVVLVCDEHELQLPDEVEIQPLSALGDILEWADYTAFDVTREKLSVLKEVVGKQYQMPAGKEAQVLIRTSMPCGGMADCGVCTVTMKSNWKLSCKDGPVFDWGDV